MLNATILNYCITGIIGKGGMATVYEAVHNKLGNKVAIKILDPALSADSQIRNRFENEARAMAALSHPNIMRVIDYEETPNQLAIVMEYSEGEDLNQLIRRNGRLPVDKTVRYFTQVLDAITYAHGRGIIHRDIKPSNIFIEPGGHVKILDFGIAKIIETSAELTQTGLMLGTPVYMSPEQVKGEKDLDFRTDIYSLGVTLYFMTHGKAPYDSTGSSIYTIQSKIVNESLPEMNTNMPGDPIIQKATQKNKHFRYTSCAEMKGDIEKLGRMNSGEETLIDKPAMNFPSVSQGHTKRPRKFNYALLLIIPVIVLALFIVINSSKKKPNRNSSKTDQNRGNADDENPAIRQSDRVTTIIPENNNSEISAQTIEKHRNLFEDFHRASANLDAEGAVSYYADYALFYDKYVSRDEILGEQLKNYQKHTPAGTQILSFTPVEGIRFRYDYYLDYKATAINSYPIIYKNYRIKGIVQFDEQDKINLLKDVSTTKY